MTTPRQNTYYRIVRSNPFTAADFLSNWALREQDIAAGRRPRSVPITGDGLDMSSGVSVFDDAETAPALARRYELGGFIARLHVPGDRSIRLEKTGERHHFTLWGTPAALLTCVQSIEPV